MSHDLRTPLNGNGWRRADLVEALIALSCAGTLAAAVTGNFGFRGA